ncbi:hypothetical protein Uis1B_2173 [Bifidobacterium margollesii]|uniref:Uncharacterized protein n=1 Tax=Bifidobacterium margollesii TaxID=2020964 RepID=A0A2N5J6Z5_9BIFI|nr:hypothetical protein [Bifidobacterium margollesii]PLS29991.1 hypothetical protein Uis1B_2173 [Bifidobacterium margollesii]
MNQTATQATPRIEPYERAERDCRCALCAGVIPAGASAARITMHAADRGILSLIACTACLTVVAAMNRFDPDGRPRRTPVATFDRPAMTAWAGQTIARARAPRSQTRIGGDYLDRIQANTRH